MDSDLKFKKALKISLGIHVFCFLSFAAFALIQDFLVSLGVLEHPLKNQVIKRSIRVDVVDLPSQRAYDMKDIDLSKKAAVKKTSPENLAKASEKAMKLPGKKKQKKKPKKKNTQAKNSKSKQDRLAEIRKQLRTDAKRQDLVAEMEKQLQEGEETREAIAGNIESKGASNTGDVATSTDEYTSLIQSHVLKYWRAPGWLVSSTHEYSARVLVKLAPDGSVLTQSFTHKSGEKQFDDSVEQAIDAADPFPEPPVMLRRIVLQEGIVLGLPK